MRTARTCSRVVCRPKPVMQMQASICPQGAEHLSGGDLLCVGFLLATGTERPAPPQPPWSAPGGSQTPHTSQPWKTFTASEITASKACAALSGLVPRTANRWLLTAIRGACWGRQSCYRERPHDMRTAPLPDRDLLPAQGDGVIDHTPARYEEEEAP